MDDQPTGEPGRFSRRGRRSRAAEPPIALLNRPVRSSKRPPLAAKANDLEALQTTVVDAAGIGAGLWLSYLFVLLYLLIAAGGVRHEDLFFESPVKLPFLNIDLPLKGFFILGPPLFLIVHAYVLLHFAMLSSKVGAFDKALRDQINDVEIRTRVRRQLPSNVFVQFLAGPTEVRDGVMGFFLWLIALISLVIGPVCLLVLLELQFLPYHSAITWWQRLVVFADLLLIWLFWPSIARLEQPPRQQDDARQWMLRAERVLTRSALWGLTGGTTLLLLVFATYPGELIDTVLWQKQKPEGLLVAPGSEGRGATEVTMDGDMADRTGPRWSGRGAAVAGRGRGGPRLADACKPMVQPSGAARCERRCAFELGQQREASVPVGNGFAAWP